MSSHLPPQEASLAPEGFVDAGNLLLTADLLQVVSLLAEVVAGAAAILAGRDSAVRVVTAQVEAGLAMVVNTEVCLPHDFTDNIITIS